jgi:hypothetical protein
MGSGYAIARDPAIQLGARLPPAPDHDPGRVRDVIDRVERVARQQHEVGALAGDHGSEVGAAERRGGAVGRGGDQLIGAQAGARELA